MSVINKEAIETLVLKSDKYVKEHICPRCGEKMREDDAENSLSRYADVYICSGCGTDEAMRGFTGSALPFHEWKIVKDLCKPCV